MGGYNTHPAFGGFINDPTAQLGFQMGKSAMHAGQEYMEQNVRPLFLRRESRHAPGHFIRTASSTED